jgi:glycosyltransferase involved in cell wall biosynthesis
MYATNKIVITTFTSFPYNSAGGGDVQLYRFANGLKKNGVNLEVLSIKPLDASRVDFKVDFTVKCFTIPLTTPLASIFFIKYIFVTLFFLPYLWKSRRMIQFIYCFSYRYMSIVMAFSKWILKKPVMCHIIDSGSKLSRFSFRWSFLHGSSLIGRILQGFYYVFDLIEEKVTLRLADVVICDGVDRYYELKGVLGNKVYFIPDIVEVVFEEEDEDALHEYLEVGNDNIVISYIGRLSFEKGIDLFLRIAYVFLNKYPKVKFIVAGDGPYSALLKKIKLSNLIYLGYIRNVHKIYHLCDIVVIPSRLEGGVSSTLVESLSYGKIVIASDIPNNAYVIKHEFNGFLFKNGDLFSLLRILRYVVENLHTEKMTNVKTEAVKTSRRFHARFLVQRLIQVYSKILSTNQ